VASDPNDRPDAFPAPPGLEIDPLPVIDAFWEALQRGEVTRPDEWIEKHGEGAHAHEDLRLLASLQDAREILEEDSQLEPSPPMGEESAGEVDSLSQILLPGTKIGHYTIGSLLGRGGMGDVYLAEHELMKQRVALKVLSPHLAGNSHLLERFHGEMEMLAQLTNPHIVAAKYAGTDGGVTYLVMEYVPGTDLQKYVSEHGPLDSTEACNFIRQAAQGLEYAHRKGIVHRDIKPSNLLLTPGGNIKILDLGLAKLALPELLDGHPSPTSPGALLGTLNYISPEQVDDATQADERSDLYSLGCTFYYLLTGRAPFRATSRVERQQSSSPDPIEKVRPELPSAVTAIVSKLLANNRAERYSSARALVDALDIATRGKLSKRPWRIVVPTIVTTLLLVGVVYFTTRPHLWNATTNGGGGLIPATAQEGSLRLEHYRLVTKDRIQHLGAIGEKSFVLQQGDRVVAKAVFDEPLYVYLIVVNPDGSSDLLFPEEQPSKPIREMVSPLGSTDYWTLNDTGFVCFVVMASREPLPPFGESRPTVDAGAWKSAKPVDPWLFDGKRCEPLVKDRIGHSEDGPKPLADLCNHLKGKTGVIAVRAIAFRVQPAAKPEKGG
jgi:serine/threonine protein kinase